MNAINKNRTSILTILMMVLSALVALAACAFLLILKYAWALNLWILCVTIDTIFVIVMAINKSKRKREEMLKKYADVLAGDSLKIKGKLKKRMLCGIKAYHNNRYDAALMIFESLRKEDCPQDTKRSILMFLGMCHAKMKRYGEARWYFDEVLDFQYDPRLLSCMGRVFGRHKQYEISERYFLRALALAPDDLQLLLCLAEIENHFKRYDKVLEFGKRALESPEVNTLLNKKRAALFALLARASMETYDFEGAFSYTEAILKIFPRDTDAHYVRAACYAVQKDEDNYREAMKFARNWGGDPKVVDDQMAEFLDKYTASRNE